MTKQHGTDGEKSFHADLLKIPKRDVCAGLAATARRVTPEAPAAPPHWSQFLRALRWCDSHRVRKDQASAHRRAHQLSMGSPASHRAAKHRMTKCRSTFPCSSRAITSRWPVSTTGSIESEVPSRTSRITASTSVSPASTGAARQRVEVECRLAARGAPPELSDFRIMAALTAR